METTIGYELTNWTLVDTARPRGVLGSASVIVGLVLVLVLVILAPAGTARAQEVQVDLSAVDGSADRRASIPDPRGGALGVQVQPIPFLGFRLSASRQWADSRGRSCPPPDFVCDGHPTETRVGIVTAGAAAWLSTPRVAGLRLGAGYGLSADWTDAEVENLDTGEVSAFEDEPDNPTRGHGWEVAVDWALPFAERMGLRASYGRHDYDWGSCDVLDGRAVCGDGSVRQLGLGVAYRFR